MPYEKIQDPPLRLKGRFRPMAEGFTFQPSITPGRMRTAERLGKKSPLGAWAAIKRSYEKNPLDGWVRKNAALFE